MQKNYLFGVWLIRILLFMILPVATSAQFSFFQQYGKEMGYTGGGNYGNSTMLQDRRGYLWFATINGLNRFDGQRFKVFQYDHYDRSGISSNEVTALVEDPHGFIWIGTTDGLNRFDPTSEQFVAFHPDPGDPASIAANVINHLLVDQQGRLWVSTRKTLNLYLPESGTFKHFTLAENEAGIPPLRGILHLAEGADGHIWIADNAGLFRFNPQTKSFSCYYRTGNGAERYHTPRVIYKDRKDRIWVGIHFKGLATVNEAEKNLHFSNCQLSNESGKPDHLIESITEDSRGVFWIGTRNGLYQFDPAACAFTKFVHDPTDPQGILPGEVMDIYQDRQEVFWLMNWAQSKINSFAPYRAGVEVLTDKAVNGMTAISEDTFLLATKKELWLFDRRENTLSKAITTNRLEQLQPFEKSSTYFRQVLIDKTGKYLAGTFGGGFYVIDPETGKAQHLLGEATIYKMISMPDDRVLISASGSLFLYDPATGDLDEASDSYEFSKLGKKHCLDIYQDQQKNLWLATAYNGLYLYHVQQDTILHFLNDHDDPNSLSSNNVRRIFEAKDGKFWFCTGSGLDEYDPAHRTFRHFSAKNGIESSTSINALIQDNSGLLWFTTASSLYRFDPVKGTATKAFERDVLSVVDIPPTFHQQNDNGIYFSSYLGLSKFQPEALKQKNRILGLVFTDLKLFNQSVEIGAPDSILSKKIAFTEALHLKHHQNNISIAYQSISFKESGLINYAYRLEGFDLDWQEIGTKKEATYTNLNPGAYTFSVKARYQNEAWSEQTASLQIFIALPWWKTPLALILWASIFISFSYLLYRFLLNRQLERAEAKQLKEIHNFKNQLYTSITHEFRTPLTVILGITEHLKEKWESLSISRAEKHLDMIDRSGKGLLKLVNQMLDLSRLEANKMELVYIRGEIISYLSYLLEAMESLAETRKVRLKKHFEVQRLEMDYDPDKLQIVLANLLSNAIKFTPPGGQVSLRAQKLERPGQEADHLVIEVSDTGIGIAPENLDQIFQPFFQVDPQGDQPGTGIGLNLTRKLVNLMGGNLSVKSMAGEGTVFTLQFPIRQEASPLISGERPQFSAPVVDQLSGPFSPPEQTAEGHPLPQLLLIEDNADLIRYLQECLQDTYQLTIAKNGEEGVQKALETIPDVIISDVMMPKKDGFAVCKELKYDERTSHIPIVLLTAKASIEDRLSGLERGADAYLTKPFNKRELLIRLEQLIKLRQQLKKRYTGGRLPAIGDNGLVQVEDAFIFKVNNIILNQLDNTEFDSAGLCQALLMSNSQLYRKLKALTGESIAVYIRSVRLQQARQLLVETDLKISEIAYEVGFKDLAYFSKCFTKKFGQTPKKFRQGTRTA